MTNQPIDFVINIDYFFLCCNIPLSSLCLLLYCFPLSFFFFNCYSYPPPPPPSPFVCSSLFLVSLLHLSFPLVSKTFLFFPSSLLFSLSSSSLLLLFLACYFSSTSYLFLYFLSSASCVTFFYFLLFPLVTCSWRRNLLFTLSHGYRFPISWLVSGFSGGGQDVTSPPHPPHLLTPALTLTSTVQGERREE